MNSTALHTDQYELTMIDVALTNGVAERPAIFDVYTRRLPAGRPYGVYAGTGRLIEAIQNFRFNDDQLAWLSRNNIVSVDTLKWLADYRFVGDINAYREGDLFFPNSPVFSVKATFAQAVILETLILSILNHDSAIASTAARIAQQAGGRTLIDMGSRRTDDQAGVAAARAAYIAGFDATSNLQAGWEYGVPTVGTTAHAFTLAHSTEREAFEAQIAAHGANTTLLIDTYDVAEGVANAIAAGGPNLAAVRIDSGDLAAHAHRIRRQLDEAGNTRTRIVATSDLDEYAISRLQDVPIDAYGVGTRLVANNEAPTIGFVYKLVARGAEDGSWVPVEKHSENKASIGGEKWSYRLIDRGRATVEHIAVGHPCIPAQGRAANVPIVKNGEAVASWDVYDAKFFHRHAIAELEPAHRRRLAAGSPAIRTEHIDGHVCRHVNEVPYQLVHQRATVLQGVHT